MGIHVLSNKSFRYITTKKPNHQTKPAWHRTSAGSDKKIYFLKLSVVLMEVLQFIGSCSGLVGHIPLKLSIIMLKVIICADLWGYFQGFQNIALGILFHSWLFKKKKSIISNNKMFTMVSVSFSQQVGLKASFIISFASVVIQKVEWFSRHLKWSLQQFECFI